jgi:gliding motility-associated-like protein
MRFFINFIGIFIVLLQPIQAVFSQDISASQTFGCDSLKVQFSYSPQLTTDTRWFWTFGNGDTSTLKTPPAESYYTEGIYTVRLIVNRDKDTITKTNFIEVSRAPIPVFTYTDTSTNGSYSRLFAFSPEPNDTHSYTLSWDFGDNSTATGNSIIHPYEKINNLYPVKLTITSEKGCQNSNIENVGIFEVFKVPNVFTPNGDNIDDYFHVFSEYGTTLSLKVFNRYGTLVYKETSPDINWDGRTASGTLLEPGILYYVIETLGGSPNHQQTGFIYLYR